MLAIVFFQAGGSIHGCYWLQELGCWGPFLWLDEGSRVTCPAGPSASSQELPLQHWQLRGRNQHPPCPSQSRPPDMNVSTDVGLWSLRKARYIFKVESPGNTNVCRTLLDCLFPSMTCHWSPFLWDKDTRYTNPVLKEIFSLYHLATFKNFDSVLYSAITFVMCLLCGETHTCQYHDAKTTIPLWITRKNNSNRRQTTKMDTVMSMCVCAKLLRSCPTVRPRGL